MGTAVVMPQMGESIAEGTIVRWIKKVGDAVDRDEPLFEISTDKVDAEIPSPAAGVLTEIKVGKVKPFPSTPWSARSGPKEKWRAPLRRWPPGRQGRGCGIDAAAGRWHSCPGLRRRGARRSGASSPFQDERPARRAAVSKDDLRRQKSSPLVRRIARDHNIDITSLSGSGIGGRVTKNDIFGYLNGIRDRDSGFGRAIAIGARPASPAPSPRSLPPSNPAIPNPESTESRSSRSP